MSKKGKIENPVDGAIKISELEALKFGKLDAEIRNAVLSIQISNYKKYEIKMEAEAKLRKEEETVAELNQMIKVLRPQYEQLIEEIAAKYKIKDKTKITIDPDTGIVREV